VEEGNGYCQLSGYQHSSKYLLQNINKKETNTGLVQHKGLVNDDNILIFG